ncbi:unnamed protein product [Orchesella dallaii]|uniref:Uncharacterized protein n=1 Tax=Orchesella dallaii TaxID=48710 RepID=A0ABP1QTY9_9HEXA
MLSHSQYYPQTNEDHSSQLSSLFSTTRRTIPENTPQYHFNTRNLNPPYREYQHQHDQYRINAPSSDVVTVKYYGTKRDDDDDYDNAPGQNPNSRRFPQESSQLAPPASSAAYRKLPGISRNPQFVPGNFDFGGVSIAIGEGDGGIDFAIRDPSNEGTDFFRIRNRDRHPQKSTSRMPPRNDMRRMNDEPNERSLERPVDTL